ncbi:MAG: ABC transporter permease [Rhodanobacter sp.]
MFGYYLELGLRSLRRNPMLTALMVVAIGFGVAASMTTYAVFRAVSGNPIPDKSAQLFKPQIDNWGPSHRNNGEGPSAMDYTDAMALMRDRAAPLQTVSYPVNLSIVPVGASSQPFLVPGYATYSDFFRMFEVPFQYGTAWPESDDSKHGSSIVIGSALNQKLFGGIDSVGKSIEIGSNAFRVIGVIKPWNPTPRFYDVVNNGSFDDPPQFWIPFTRAIDLQIPTYGNRNCPSQSEPGWEGQLRSECIWLSYWVQLPDATAVAKYRRYLEGYAAAQQRAGRFHWAPSVHLSNVMQWLNKQHVVPPETEVSMLLAFGFLLVCLVNTIGLLLAKFMRRAPEIGVRRALGASRRAIYAQFLLEAGVVGAAGGLLGLALTALGVAGIGIVFEPDIARLAHINLSLLLLTLLLAISCTVIAAVYPTWRASRVQPAWQLKSN